eukprot:g1197.t1
MLLFSDPEGFRAIGDVEIGESGIPEFTFLRGRRDGIEGADGIRAFVDVRFAGTSWPRLLLMRGQRGQAQSVAAVGTAAADAGRHHDRSRVQPRRATAVAFQPAQPGADGALRCSDGSAALDAAQLNDDYCDCDDGSDEPRTSACSHTRALFECVNGDYPSELVPTARVGDGVCDCCDGSDERSGVCGNTCRAVHEAARQRARARLRSAVEGRRARSRAVLEAQQQVKQWHADIELGEREDARLQELQQYIEYYKLKEEKAEHEMRLARARALLRTSKGAQGVEGQPATAVATTATAAAGTTDSATGEGGSPGAARVLRATVELSNGKRLSFAEYFKARKAEQAAPASAKRHKLTRTQERRKGVLRTLLNGKSESARRGALERLLGWAGLLLSPVTLSVDAAFAVWSVLSAACGAVQRVTARVLPEGARHTLSAATNFTAAEVGAQALSALPRPIRSRVRAALRYFSGLSFQRASWATRIMWRAPHEYYAWYWPALDADLARPEANSLRSLHTLVADERRHLATRAAETQKLLSENFGAERAFLTLKGACFERRSGEYLYKACPFSNVTQDGTILGTYEVWGTAPGGADYTAVQHFGKGEHCFATQRPRTAEVRFVCGAEARVEDIDEPTPCEYAVVLALPMACSDAVFEAAFAEARRLGVAQDTCTGDGQCGARDDAPQ